MSSCGNKYVINPFTGGFDAIAVGKSSVAASPTILNIAIPLANTEQTLTLPNQTKRFMFRLRETDATVKLRFVSGGNYITIRPGVSYTEDILSTIDVELFYECNKPGKTIELLYWV